MSKIIVGKIMKVNKELNKILFEDGEEFFVAFEQGEIVKVISDKHGDNSYLECVNKKGFYQGVPASYLEECSDQEKDYFEASHLNDFNLVGKIMKIDRKLNPYIKENGKEFQFSFKHGELVIVQCENKSNEQFVSFKCSNKEGHMQNIPYQYLQSCTPEEEESFYKTEELETSKLDLVELQLAKALQELELKEQTILKLKKKQVDRDIEIKLLKKELNKNEN